MMDSAAFVVVVLAAAYLAVLGISSLARPRRTKVFLGAFASSRRVHFTELALRLLVGCSLVVTAPRMLCSAAFSAFGWILVGTTLLLAFLPWRLHRRFAAWSVPQATRCMSLFGLGSILGALLLLGAMLAHPGAG